jgi:hypothetical protein
MSTILFLSRDVAKIDKVGMELCKLGVGVALEQEDNAAGFLGVSMEHDSSTGLLELKLKQTGLMKELLKLWVWMMGMLA